MIIQWFKRRLTATVQSKFDWSRTTNEVMLAAHLKQTLLVEKLRMSYSRTSPEKLIKLLRAKSIGRLLYTTFLWKLSDWEGIGHATTSDTASENSPSISITNSSVRPCWDKN